MDDEENNMKRLSIALLCLILVGLCACGRTMPEETTTEETTTGKTSKAETSTAKIDPSVLELYADAIETYCALPDGTAWKDADHYFLYDIDGDGIQELLLGMEWGGNTHLNGEPYLPDGAIFLTDIYAIQDGVAVWQEEFHWSTEPDREYPAVLLKNGLIRLDIHDWKPDLELLTYYYCFENGN